MCSSRQFGALSGEPGRKAVAAMIAPPTFLAAFWMVLLLIPLAAFFSAICLSLAVLARSMKEGQYYMTPLFMVCLPLVFLTLFPGIELNLFYSLVPITGVALLLRALIMGNYGVALRYFLPVLVPTLVYAAIALRWAIDLFQREEVLFREAEQFSLYSWFRHLFRDREPRPTGGQAILCFATDAQCIVVLAAVPGLHGFAARLEGDGRGSAHDLDSAGDDGDSAHVKAGIDIAAPVARVAICHSGRSAGLFAQSHGERAQAAGGMAFSNLVGDQGLAFADALAVADLGDDDRRLRPGAGDLRGICISGFHSFGPRAPASHPFGDPALGAHVRVPSRPAFAFPAALQRDPLGDRAGAARGAEREHSSRPDFPFAEQHHSGLAGIPGEGVIHSSRHPLDLSQAGRRTLSCGVDGGKRHNLGVLAVLPVEAEVRSEVRGDAQLRRDTLTLQARYILPVEGSPIEDGCLTIKRGRIAWLGSASEREGDLDLGNVAIVPGFVNAHTHLELKPIEGKLSGKADEAEIPWLKRVIDQRRAGTEETTNEIVAQHQGRDRSGHDLPCRYHDGRAELGADR